MRKVLKFIAPVLVIAAGFGLVQAMNAAKPEPEKKEEPQRLLSLFFDGVEQTQVTLSVQSQGEVQARTQIDLVPQVSGQIVSISPQFAEGAKFGPKTALIKIDDTDYRLAVTQAEARVAEAEVKVLQEKANASIKLRQWNSAKRSADPTPLQINRPQVIEAEAKLRSAKASLAEAELNLARTQIRVPFAGRVLERNVGVGQFVTMGTPVGKVFATDVIEVPLALSDGQLEELNLPMGFESNGDSGPAVELSAMMGSQERIWHGRIVRTHASMDQQTRLITTIAQVIDPYGAGASDGMPLAVGMFVKARIEGSHEQTALTMPRDALRNADKVYVINDEDELEIRTVKVLSTSVNRVFVTSGVVPGERVVTSTIASAVDGMKVQPIARNTDDPQPSSEAVAEGLASQTAMTATAAASN